MSEQIEPTELDDLRSRVAKQRIILAQNSVEITEQKRALAKADRANVHLKMTVTQLTQDLAVAQDLHESDDVLKVFGGTTTTLISDIISALGDWHDEGYCDGPQDLIDEVKAVVAKADAAPQVRECPGHIHERVPEMDEVTDEYAAANRCKCGAGLARDDKNKRWDCSAILLGTAIPMGHEGSVQHDDVPDQSWILCDFCSRCGAALEGTKE